MGTFAIGFFMGAAACGWLMNKIQDHNAKHMNTARERYDLNLKADTTGRDRRDAVAPLEITS